MPELERNKNKKTRGKMVLIGAIVILVIGILLGIVLNRKITSSFKKKDDVSVSYISGKLKDVGKLTTQEVKYTAEISMIEGDIPFLTKKGFTMRYNATMEAGIEFSDMKIKVTNSKVLVKIPHAKVMSNKVDPSSIEFKDEKQSLLQWNTKEDTAEAIEAAEKDIKKNPTVDTSELIKEADANTKKLIQKLLEDSVGDRDVEIKFVRSLF